jgi:hypothetical protein
MIIVLFSLFVYISLSEGFAYLLGPEGE